MPSFVTLNLISWLLAVLVFRVGTELTFQKGFNSLCSIKECLTQVTPICCVSTLYFKFSFIRIAVRGNTCAFSVVTGQQDIKCLTYAPFSEKALNYKSIFNLYNQLIRKCRLMAHIYKLQEPVNTCNKAAFNPKCCISVFVCYIHFLAKPKCLVPQVQQYICYFRRLQTTHWQSVVSHLISKPSNLNVCVWTQMPNSS